MLDDRVPCWSDVLSQLEKLRTFAGHLKNEAPNEADFIPAFAPMADFVLGAAERVSADAWHLASQMIDEMLIELGYLPPPIIRPAPPFD